MSIEGMCVMEICEKKEQYTPPEELRIKTSEVHLEIINEIQRNPVSSNTSILISGPPRCGKSILAKEICKKHEMFHLKTDYVKSILYEGLEFKQRKWAASYIYRKVLLGFPTGVVIEGTALTDISKNIPYWATNKGRDIPFFCLGYTSCYLMKFGKMLEYSQTNKCWTNGKLSEDQLRDLAKHIVEKSVHNKIICDQNGFKFFEIGTNNFKADINHIIAEIEVSYFKLNQNDTRTLKGFLRSGLIRVKMLLK